MYFYIYLYKEGVAGVRLFFGAGWLVYWPAALVYTRICIHVYTHIYMYTCISTYVCT